MARSLKAKKNPSTKDPPVEFTRARMTQIMNLLQLAPDIQEELLFLPRIERGDSPIHERQLRPIAAVYDWCKQRTMWNDLIRSAPARRSM
jgi:hypothetical protein